MNTGQMDENRDYSKLSNDKKARLVNQIDNFIEALYLSPHIFPKNVLKIMKIREDKLSIWRLTGQIIGGITIFGSYTIYRFKSWKGYYFKNVCIALILSAVGSYASGRISEYIGNRMYYRDTLIKLAINFNISDEEISDLQLKISENYLERNKSEVNKNNEVNKSSLDKVKFKV